MTNSVGNASLSSFDALVIGSGAAGAAVAFVLTSAGKRVLVLEAGANHFEGLDDATKQPISRHSNDELKYRRRHFLSPHPLIEPRTFRPDDTAGDHTFIGSVNELPKTVGGGAVHADLKTPRFAPNDFTLGTALRDVSNASFADWPVQYDELEPFYAYVERLIGVQGQDGADPFAGPRSNLYPMPPGLAMYGPRRLAEGAKKLGYHPFPFPGALNSQPYDGRPACVDCGFCSGYGCPSNAKGSPAVTTLRRALLTGNCQLLVETRATRLVLNETKTAVVRVEAIGPDGAKRTYTADTYVLAASPIEDARLLFLSEPSGIGNSSGLVGRNLMFHLQTAVAGIFDERMHSYRGRTSSHCMTDFRGVPNDAKRPLGGIVELTGSQMPIDEVGSYGQIMERVGGFDGVRLKSLMRQSPIRDRLVSLEMQGEDAPQTTNYVDLDPTVRDLDGLPVARVTYKNHPFELSASKFYQPKLVAILGAAGARYGLVSPLSDIPSSRHIFGTLRFGHDPATSVCDPDGRFHDVGNLYAADGSLFPTSSGYNPTLTIIALAMRVAGAMVYPGAPERALG